MDQTETPASDSDLVAAILRGDRELFAELVRRHESAVFGIAWSRLGDRSLAEEAAQETFIQAYKRLNILREGARFGAWLTAIARHVAINTGIRNRREIEKRQRWKLEQPSAEQPPAASEPETPADTLRQVLATLPPLHRETLVLFYLEGKSIAEAAAVLGISKTAFKTRLHRARGLMRTAIEASLEDGLERLRPSRQFSAAVMLALPAQPAAFTSGGLLALFGKILPASWNFLLIQAIAILPGWLFGSWLLRKDRENFQDAAGFRARNFELMRRSAFWMLPVLMLVSAFLFLPEFRPGLVLFGACFLGISIWSIRRVRLIPPRQAIQEILLGPIGITVLLAMALDWPSYWLMIGNALLFALFSITMARLPLRMDYSLFLRAADGLLPDTPAIPIPEAGYSRAQLRAFARFLGTRNLATDFRWRGGRLELRLTPVTPGIADALLPFRWGGAAVISLNPAGEVRAFPGTRAGRELPRLGFHEPPAELSTRVAASLACALHAHSQERLDLAENLLGETAPAEIYRVPPERTASSRVRVWMFRAIALLYLILAFYFYADYWDGRRQGLTRVELSETQLRRGLENLLIETDPRTLLEIFQLQGFLFPERRFFTPPALTAFHQLLQARFDEHAARGHSIPPARAMLGDDLFLRAFASGLLTSAEFSAFGFTIEELRRDIESWPDREKRRYLSFNPIHAGQLSYTVLDTRRLSLRVQFLSACGFLHQFDLTGAVPALIERQILPESAPDDRWLDLNSARLRGLFLMIRSNPLRDTYDTLSLLKILGALDQINREACVEGILRFHKGRGLFEDPPGEPNWHIRGGAIDAFAARESLRLLGALDHLNGTDDWPIRSIRYRGPATPHSLWEALQAAALLRRAP